MIRLSAGAAGAAALVTAIPFVGRALIHRKTTDNGEIVEVDLSALAEGQMLTVDWLGQPVLIVRRSIDMIDRLTRGSTNDLADPISEQSRQPAYAKNPHRSLRPEFFVAMAVCTHLGCAPQARFKAGRDEGMPEQWAGGFVCPCHTSTFDLAGRAHLHREAKINLAIPPHRYLSANRLRIGEDPTDSS